MAFVSMIILGLVLLLYAMNDSAKLKKRADKFHEDHPVCRCQEEYLLTSQLYHKFKLEGTHKNPISDAVNNAGWEMIKRGATPMEFESGGLPIAKQCLLEYSKTVKEIDDPPMRNILDDMRFKDSFHIPSRIKLHENGYADSWTEYCKKIDEQYELLVLTSLIDAGVIDGELHESTEWYYDEVQKYYKKCGDITALYYINYDAIESKSQVFYCVYGEWQFIEDACERRKDELPKMVEERKQIREQLKKKKEQEHRAIEVSLSERPHSHGRTYKADRY